MAKSNRQKYNFLAALMTQLEDAMEEGDVLYTQYVEFQQLVAKTTELEARYDALNQWVAKLELALEELDGDGVESSGEEPEPDDDGDYDDDVAGDEPEVVSPRQGHGRVAGALERARVGEVDERGVKHGWKPQRTK